MRIFCNLLIIKIIILLPVCGLAQVKQQGINKQFSFLSTDYVEYNHKEQFIYAKGNVQIILDSYFLTANSLIYDIEQDTLWAEGNVKIIDQQNRVILGEFVILKDKLKAGIISDFILYFGDNTLLAAKLAERVNKDVFRLHNSTFTPCKILCNQKPIWQVSAKNTEIDINKNIMVYKHLFFEIYGVPIFYTPYFSHPTPKAPAKSGILMPEWRDNALGIPLYYRAKSNLDFTLTPRFFWKKHDTTYTIFELETRYKPNESDYISLDANYGKVPYSLNDGDITIKNTKVNSYYLLSNGNFIKNDYRYGFRLERTSDKAYLKNYYNNYTSYLTSKLYLEHVNNYNYSLVEGMYFEGLGINDSSSTSPLIFPKVRTKNVIPLNDDETTNLVVENNALIYKEKSGRELGQVALQLAVDNNFLTSSGNLFNVTLRNRADVYFINHLYLNDYRTNKVLTRNIPEIQNTWRYPLVGSIFDKASLFVEPIISATIGRKHNSNKKFSFIDPSKYELSENNIFSSNRYSGIDYHEFGNRLSYGVNSSILSEQNYSSVFLGQTYNTNLINSKSVDNIENVGRISSSLSDKIELFYRFRKSKNFKPIRDELGGSLNSKTIQLTAGFVRILNLRKYYSTDELIDSKVRQLYYNLTYQLAENWSIAYDMRIDWSKDKINILSKSIQVTYLNDCVRIAGKLSDNYMGDSSRGIKKTFAVPTISVGLKILNM
ncbi:LPS-assembly protein LptD [Candidatus Tisiphia endosymbiont of Mystacides longicornis]|uniref:LPS-assembly protein LptD n=1 Tax=Candidatus Tisiphia endosymbiont of Mystacides longicornis TaxID=3139330 RepID=UPI003CCB49F8